MTPVSLKNVFSLAANRRYEADCVQQAMDILLYSFSISLIESYSFSQGMFYLVLSVFTNAFVYTTYCYPDTGDGVSDKPRPLGLQLVH